MFTLGSKGVDRRQRYTRMITADIKLCWPNRQTQDPGLVSIGPYTKVVSFVNLYEKIQNCL